MNEFKRREGLERLRKAEAAGRVADSMDVRMALVARMRAGELTLEQVQAELKRIKRSSNAIGKVTRTQAFRGS